jgi:prefoldin subunit 5
MNSNRLAQKYKQLNKYTEAINEDVAVIKNDITTINENIAIIKKDVKELSKPSVEEKP